MGIAILMTCASSAQVTSVVFEDDFSSETIDASRYTEKTPFLRVEPAIFMRNQAMVLCGL